MESIRLNWNTLPVSGYPPNCTAISVGSFHPMYHALATGNEKLISARVDRAILTFVRVALFFFPRILHVRRSRATVMKINGNSEIAIEKIQSLNVGATVIHSNDPRKKMIFNTNLNTSQHFNELNLRRQ
jgi:hypothetical protein